MNPDDVEINYNYEKELQLNQIGSNIDLEIKYNKIRQINENICLMKEIRDNDCLMEAIQNKINLEELTDNKLLAISQYYDMTEFHISNDDEITDDGIKYMTHIRKLNLECNEQITDEGIKHMTQMQKLNLTLAYVSYV